MPNAFTIEDAVEGRKKKRHHLTLTKFYSVLIHPYYFFCVYVTLIGRNF